MRRDTEDGRIQATPREAKVNSVRVDAGRALHRPEAIAHDGIAAMLMFVAAEVMLFAGFISAFVIVKAGAPLWPPIGQPRLAVTATACNSLVLLASGVALYLADRAFTESGTVDRPRRLLGLAMALGAFFVVFQGYEWIRLIRFGLTMTSSTYGSFFYLIVGAHALHAVAALVALGWTTVRLRRGDLSLAVFRSTQVFWYFVVGVWPILYVLVYLP